MRLSIKYVYPRKLKGEKEYGKSQGTVSVSSDTLDNFIGEVNTIDCVCGIMKLIIMSKQKNDTPFRRDIVRFFEQIDDFNDSVNNAVIDFFTKENETADDVRVLNDFRDVSSKLTRSFIRIISSLK